MAIEQINLSGPLVEGPRLSKTLQDFLSQLRAQATATQTAVTTVTETVTNTINNTVSVSLDGQNGVRVTGSSEAGYVIDGLADQHVLASQIFGG